MSIHRGGPPGAVAVTYNSMAPLSPTRRYSSSSTGTTTSSGTTTTKYNTCRSSKAHEHMSYSAATSTNYLSAARKTHYSPSRSVSSYSEGGSVSSTASKLSPKYSSTSTSSASSTASSVSSSNNRDRYNLTASNNIIDSELRSKYSPDTYVPAIYRNNSSNSSLSSNSSTLNGHCKSFPSSLSTSGLAELHGGDERDSTGYREHRDRSYSNEITNSLAGGQVDRWSVNNRHTKRRNNQLNTLLTGHDQIDSAAAPTEEESSSSRPPRSSRIPTRRDENNGLNGLRNIGNTCFMNSVIQCLSNTKPLLEYLLNEQYLNDINQTTSSMKGALIKAFAHVINELWESSGDHVVNTSSLKNQIQRFAPRFMGYAQQDAQEFLRYLLEGLHEDVNRVFAKPQPILTDIPDHFTDSQKATESWKRYLRSEDSTIVDVFVGQLRSSLQCTSCEHISVTLDPFWDLSLPIPARSGTVKLNQCLEHFTKTEVMDGDEKPTCSKCQMRRKCTKRFSIQKFPKILVIHLKRFSPTERFRAKLSVLVDFPLTGLDLSAFAATGVQGCTYNLYGVANHSGTPYSGHYTAYCKHPYSGEWHEYNDSRVSSVSASSVISGEAYVLFYEQQSQSQQQQQPLSHHL